MAIRCFFNLTLIGFNGVKFDFLHVLSPAVGIPFILSPYLLSPYVRFYFIIKFFFIGAQSTRYGTL